MKEQFNIGDLLLHLDTDLYYCIEIQSDRYIFTMLNPKKGTRITKRIFFRDETPKIINNPYHWKHYPVIE
jgi:hypothetical protein